MTNVNVMSGGHRIVFTEEDDLTYWECLTCSSAGSSSDFLKAEEKADTHAERNARSN